MNLTHDQNIILNVLKRKPKLGKTAVMKVVFMLQQVENLKLSYNYSIYTYGPYSSEVTDDVDNLIADGLITSTMYPYQNYIGYELNLSSNGKDSLQDINSAEEKSIEKILAFIDGKSAKDLELYSTIIHVRKLYQNNKDSVEQDVIKKVHEIKPHFDNSTITDAYGNLKSNKYIS